MAAATPKRSYAAIAAKTPQTYYVITKDAYKLTTYKGRLTCHTAATIHLAVDTYNHKFMCDVTIPDSDVPYDQNKPIVMDTVTVVRVLPLEEHPLWNDPAIASKFAEKHPNIIKNLPKLHPNFITPDILKHHIYYFNGNYTRDELKFAHYVELAEHGAYVHCMPSEIVDDPAFWDAVMLKNPSLVTSMPLKFFKLRDYDLLHNTICSIVLNDYCRRRHVAQGILRDMSQDLPITEMQAFIIANFLRCEVTTSQFKRLPRIMQEALAKYAPHTLSVVSSELLEVGTLYALTDGVPTHPTLEYQEFQRCFMEPVRATFARLLHTDPFISDLLAAGLIRNIYGGLIREISIMIAKDPTQIITWDTLSEYLATADVDLDLDIPKSEQIPTSDVATDEEPDAVYDLTKIVSLVNKYNGAIALLKVDYKGKTSIDGTEVTRASKGTYAVWISHNGTIRKYDLNVGYEPECDDALFNTARFSAGCLSTDTDPYISLRGATIIAEDFSESSLPMLRNRLLFANPDKVRYNDYVGAKIIWRFSKFWRKGFKLPKETAVLLWFILKQYRDRPNPAMDEHIGFNVNEDVKPVKQNYKTVHTIYLASGTVRRIEPHTDVNAAYGTDFINACAAAAAKWDECI